MIRFALPCCAVSHIAARMERGLLCVERWKQKDLAPDLSQLLFKTQKKTSPTEEGGWGEILRDFFFASPSELVMTCC